MSAGKRWLAPYVATLFAMLALQMSNLGFSPLLPAMRSQFHMTFAQMGLFAGMYGLLAIIWSVPAGLMATRFGEKLVLASGLGAVAVGLAALSQAPGFIAAFGARAIWLSGYRFSFVCVMVAVALTCPASVRGASMGILGAVSSLASVIGAPLGGFIGRDFGWRNGILAYAGVAPAGALVFTIFYRSDPGTLRASPESINVSAFRSPLLWSLALLSGLAGMGSLSANFFVPSAAQALFHLDAVGASYLISTGFTLAIFVNLLFGFLMDRFHRWKVMAALAGLGMLGGIGMTSHDLLVFRVGTALVLALGHAGIQQSYTLAADVLRGRETGNVMGVVSMVAGIFSYLGPQMLGLLRDWSGGFVAGWYFIIAAAALTLLLVLALWSYSSHAARQIAAVAGALVAISLVLPLRAQTAPQYGWIEPGQGGMLPSEIQFDDAQGRLGIVNASGPVDTTGNPFFEPLGANGRACVTCHQPAYAMTLSAAGIRERWLKTRGKDPLFASVDGSNCPDLPQEKESSHSLLLNRGLIRLAIPWPPPNRKPEFSIEVVSDPTGCNTSAKYGLNSAHPAVSIFRRPRMAANLKYVTNPRPQFALKLGGLADVDPETGEPVSMNFMADAREPSLRSQARNAALQHEQSPGPLPDSAVRRIVEFESQIYVAQIFDAKAGDLAEPGGPPALGPRAMAGHHPGVLGDNDYDPVFQLFDTWKKPAGQSEFRASVARGNDIFMFRQFWLRDATHINSIGLGNPLKRTCATCHNAQMTGQDLSAGWVDLGTTNYPTWTEPPLYSESRELPVFKITCDKDAPPHPYLGRVIYTSDPGRALISGRCVDVGSIVMQQFRGLAARAPYFSNGSMKSLRELVDFYDRRFDMKLTEQEKQDLVNFLGVL